jgi:hypothetical protein
MGTSPLALGSRERAANYTLIINPEMVSITACRETISMVGTKISAAAVTILLGLSLPRFQGQCLESCFYTDPMKTNDHNECLVYATPL